MKKPGRWVLSVLLIGIGPSACGDGQERQDAQPAPAEVGEDEALQAARAESVAMAEARYDPSAFDSISWADPETRLERGEFVFSFSCATCHGPHGRGDGETAVAHDLEMPDFTVMNWEYGGDIPAIRHRIYVGHESEMPSWGLYGLPYRDIDAVAFYIDQIFSSRGSGTD